MASCFKYVLPITSLGPITHDFLGERDHILQTLCAALSLELSTYQMNNKNSLIGC